MHTFIEKGYEFEPGVHYIGQMADWSLGRTVIDQVADGQGWFIIFTQLIW